MLIRAMDASDVAFVEEVEASFASPWTKKLILAQLDQNHAINLVAETDSKGIAGWCCGRIMAPEAELLKLAVMADRQRQGVARMLLHAFTSQLSQEGVEQIFLEVRSENAPALTLYQGLGWKKQAKRKKYYKNPVDDAILLVRSLKTNGNI